MVKGGFLCLATRAEQVGIVFQRVGKVGVEGDGVLEGCRRVVRHAQRQHGRAQVVPDELVVRLQFERVDERLGRLGQFAPLYAGIAEFVIALGTIRLQVQRTFDQSHAVVAAAGLVQQQAEEISGIGVVVVCREDGAVCRFSGAEVSRAVAG